MRIRSGRREPELESKPRLSAAEEAQQKKDQTNMENESFRHNKNEIMLAKS